MAVLVIHPNDKLSETVAITITDRTLSGFETDWNKQSAEIRQEFGDDTPLWCIAELENDMTPPKRRREMSFLDYIALVRKETKKGAN